MRRNLKSQSRLIKMRLRVYNCRGMTYRIKEEVVAEASKDKAFLEAAGFEVFCPVISEGVKVTKETLLSSKKAMEEYWPRDKWMIRQAHLVFDMTPHLNSEGSKHEIGYARYALWKPVIRVFPLGKLPIKSSVAFFEDDFICDSLEEAVEYAYRVHGTFLKRITWRMKLLNRCLLKWVVYQIQEWK